MNLLRLSQFVFPLLSFPSSSLSVAPFRIQRSNPLSLYLTGRHKEAILPALRLDLLAAAVIFG